MEYKELSVVICTKKDEKDCANISQVLYDRAGCPVHVFFCLNPNGTPIAQAYQQMLDREDVNKNVIVFMHDDVDVLTVGFGKKLLEIFEKNPDYGIIGLGGSKQFDERAMWWNYEKKYGQVIHKKDDENKTWLTNFSLPFEKDVEPVLVVDGLFFGVDPSRIKEGFDIKMPGFDFYDICISINNNLKGVKVGVTTKILVCHHSMGKLREGWFQNRAITNELLYGKYYPMDLDEGIIEKNTDVKAYLTEKYEQAKKESEEAQNNKQKEEENGKKENMG
jgi:hypothetical protein